MDQLKNHNSSEYFPALTGVRAIAAYMVFIHHFNPYANNENHKRLLYFFTEFNVGVTLFFVLSGFLIGYRYFGFSKLDFKQYIVNRIARIYPMYFLLTIATFIFLFITKSESIGENIKLLTLNITFLRGYFQDIKFSGISQGWSLTVEETFYFLAPVIFVLLKRKKIFWIILPLFFLGIGFVLVYVFKNNNCYGFMSTNQFMLRYTFLGRSAEFFIGIGLAVFYNKFRLTFKTNYFTLIGVLFSLIFIIALSILGSGYSGAGHPIGMFINSVLLPLFGFAPLFWGLIQEQNFVSKILSHKFFVLLGKSSYIFYLIHLGIIYIFLHQFIASHIVLFILLNIISIILYKGIEEPLNNFIRKKYKLSLLKPSVFNSNTKE